MGLYDDGRFDAVAARQLSLENRHDCIPLNFKRRKASAQAIQGALDFGTPREDQKFPRRDIQATRALTQGYGRNAPRITAEEHQEILVQGGQPAAPARPAGEPNRLKSVSSEKGYRVGCESTSSELRLCSERTIRNEAHHAQGLTTKKKVPPTGKVVYLEPTQIIARHKDQNVEALKRFRNLLNEEENKLKEIEYSTKRIDILAFNRLKRMMWYPREAILGSIPGVEVGDEFEYRLELKVVGLHRPHRSGIDYLEKSGTIIATSIVASGGYVNDIDDPDVLVYCGHGGLPMKGDKHPKDQKLERGNLALKNTIDARNAVRVILGSKELKNSGSINARGKLGPYYVYNGLYMVETYGQETGCSGASVFKFRLRRLPDQPNLHLGKFSKKRKVH